MKSELKENNRVIDSFGIHNKKDRAISSREIGYVYQKAIGIKGL